MDRIKNLEDKIKETRIAMENITPQHPLHHYFKEELSRYLEQYLEITGRDYVQSQN